MTTAVVRTHALMKINHLQVQRQRDLLTSQVTSVSAYLNRKFPAREMVSTSFFVAKLRVTPLGGVTWNEQS